MTTDLRSGKLAQAAGVNLQTLRYYERRGLLAEPRRSPGGHRLYPPEALTLLRVIKTAQRLGFTLDEVAELVDLGAHRHGRPTSGRNTTGRNTTGRNTTGRNTTGRNTTGRNTTGRNTTGLQRRAAAKLAEIESRIADLQIIAESLRAALEAGCDDLATCATTECCPLPFADLDRGGQHQ